MSIPMICSAARRASSGVLDSFMPPALPRPPTGTWAFTATGPSLAQAAAASSGVRATTPGGIAMPSEDSTSLAWNSRSFKLGSGSEGAGQVWILAYVSVAERMLQIRAVEHCHGETDHKDQHDHESETTADQDGRKRRDSTSTSHLDSQPPP